MKSHNYALVTELRHLLHAHPELSGQENGTKTRLMEFITGHTPFVPVDEGTWFWVRIPGGMSEASSLPALGFRADMDALPITETLSIAHASENPGVSHKCGHDGHSASLAGLALELAQKPPRRDVYLIFQSAEETGAGGAKCAAFLKRKNIAQVFAFHNWSGIPAGCVALKSGVSQCASMGITFYFQGVTAHASQPENGSNPAKAISQLTLYALEKAGVERLDSPHPDYHGLVLATVINTSIGAKNFGISASQGQVSFTIRAEHENDLKHLHSDLLSRYQDLAQIGGFETQVETQDVFPETRNDAESIALLERAASHAGLPVVHLQHPYRASEDFGHYLKEARGAMVYIGNGEDYPHIHTADFDFRDENLEVAVDLWISVIQMLDH